MLTPYAPHTVQGTYVRSRDAYLGKMFSAARASNAAAVLVWEIMPWHVANQSYDFRSAACMPLGF